ncbi:hypothetical protein ACFVTC_30225 [Streptomyces sp. NPDC057950]|uniref:hypothetical protein n=1 Tax=Streptomyces sp. NPDC057950 TaxID=3346288 RepID=UPI0036E02CDA
MTGQTRLPRLVLSLAVWWMLIALILWLLGKALDQAATLTECASSSAFLLAIGEAGDWLRRRRKANRSPRGHRTTQSRQQPPST